MIEKLSDAYEGLTDFELNFEGGTVQVFFTEGELAVPASRLSDGSLRYLCLLAILLDPDPPPLVGIGAGNGNAPGPSTQTRRPPC